MRPIRGVVLGLLVLLAGTSCTAGTQNDPVVPDQQVLTREADDALALLEKAPLEGYAAAPVASGHDRADDKGREVSQKVKGRALFQIACSGTGTITVTIPRGHVSQLVRCGHRAAEFPFRGRLDALLVGQRDTTGAYAWRILTASS
jgi:hypothetical protein